MDSKDRRAAVSTHTLTSRETRSTSNDNADRSLKREQDLKQMADVIDLLSNNSNCGLTVDKIRQITEVGVPDTEASTITPIEPVFRHHRLETRLGPDMVDKIVRRYEFGESATAIAKDLSVAPSALLRLLSQKRVVVRKHGLTPEQDTLLGKEYEAGVTVAGLEARHRLSHGAVLRALHRSGVDMQARAPRRRR